MFSLFLCWTSLSHFVKQSNSAEMADSGSNCSIVNNSTDFTNQANTTSTSLKLQLLVMLPLDPLIDDHDSTMDTHHDDSEKIQKWDRGLEMLPGAQIAVEAINKDPCLLPGYELELVRISVDLCLPMEVFTNINALTLFANGSLEDSTIGILGLFCEKLVRTLSPLAGRDRFGLFQLSGSMSPSVREHRERYAHLSFISPSYAAYYETLLLLMKEVGWKRVLVIYEESFNLTHVHNSTSLTEGLDISFSEALTEGEDHSITDMVEEIRQSEKSIIYLSIGAKETVDLLCAAYDDGLVWPHYMWILQDHKVGDLFMYTDKGCTTEKLMEAMQNTILLRLQREQQNTSRELDMGYSYETYLQRYMTLLNNSREGLAYNKFANVMHDSVWAFALALNRSLDSIAKHNMTLMDSIKRFGKKELAYTMEQNLQFLSFEGASGHVHFGNDYDTEAIVDISLISSNNTEITIGYYNQFLEKLSFTIRSIPIDLPSDTLMNQYNLIPFPVTVLLIVVVCLCIAFTTIMFVLFIKYRRYSEIKATSPYLSLLMFLGTYLILIATLIQAMLMLTAVSPTNKVMSSALCGSVITGNIIGINLIFSTLLLRMLRVYRIFSYFGRTGKIWSDKVLVVIVLLIIGGDLALLLIWFWVDPFMVRAITHYDHHDTPPRYEIRQYCTSNNIEVWFSLIFGKVGILFVIVLFLAIKTRKIQRENFKDTKKVNVYIFITVLIIATLIPVWFLLEGTENVQGTGLVIYVAFGATGLLNQLMLFTPKVFPPMLRSLGWNVCLSPRSKLQKATIKRNGVTSNNGSVPTLSHTYPIRSPVFSPPYNNITLQPGGLNSLSIKEHRTSVKMSVV